MLINDKTKHPSNVFQLIVNGVNGEFGPNAVQLVMVGKASGQERLKFSQKKEDWFAKV